MSHLWKDERGISMEPLVDHDPGDETEVDEEGEAELRESHDPAAIEWPVRSCPPREFGQR